MKKAITAVALCGATVAFSLSPATAASRDQSLAFKAASADCGCYPSSHAVAQYAVAIRTLEAKCRETPARFVPAAWATHKDLASHGKNLSTLAVIYYTSKSIPRSLGRTNCVEVMAALAVLLESK
jgi:hypothetical protein